MIRIAYLAALKVIGHDSQAGNREFAFFNTQLGYYAACLLVANMFNSIAGLMGLPALIQQGIKQGAFHPFRRFRPLTKHNLQIPYVMSKVRSLPRA
jgi:hypothetical protein